MKKFWYHSLALTLGLVSSATAWGQYPGGANSFGASSFPVQTQQAHSILQNLPQVPQAYHAQPAATRGFVGPNNGKYQLVATGDQAAGAVYGQPPAPHVAPLPPAAPAAPDAYGQPVPGAYSQPAPAAGAPQPAMDYGYMQSLAPNCSSCGPAPMAAPYGYFPGVQSHGGGLFRGMAASAKPWFFGGGVLLFNRVDDRDIPLSFFDADYASDVLSTRDARHGTAPGFEATVGRYFNCGRNAIAATYWGVFPDDEEALRAGAAAGNYRSRLPFGFVTLPDNPTTVAVDPYDAYDWYDAAWTHALQRSSEYHNLEVNLLGFGVGGAARNFNRCTSGTLFSGKHGKRSGCGYCGGAGCGSCGSACGTSRYATGPCGLTAPPCGSRLNLTWIAGLRYFRFEDNLTFASSLQDSVINRATDDLYYDVNTTNDLVGFQLGSRADYCLGKRINMYGTAKVGIYGNRSTLYSRIATEFQTAYLNDTRTPVNPNNNQAYLFDESKTQVAFLSELGSGVGVRISPKWTATVGYRAVIASGVATAPDNVRTAFANYEDIRDFDNHGTLILHGVNIGALYNF